MSHVGRLLVATPLISDSNFERAVLLLLAHGDGGAFGVVVNRPSETAVRAVVPAWSEAVSAPSVLFVGGPVGRDRVMGLATGAGSCFADATSLAPGDDDESPPAQRIVDDWWTVDLNRPPPLDQLGGLRLFAGSAGWAPGQLEDELAEGAWWPVDAAADDVMTTDPDALWARVLRRQGGEVAWFANHPDNPSAN